ncbi:MAG: nucleotide pyrophosphohydrolase [Candidatus Margulisiibacteriota bacterium]
MDSKTTIKQLKSKVKSFCEERDWDQYHNAKDLAIGIITEAAELLEHFRFQPDGILLSKKNEIVEEISDIFYFLLRFAQKYDIDLSSALANKLKINRSKYPIAKCKGSNKKYTEL